MAYTVLAQRRAAKPTDLQARCVCVCVGRDYGP